MNTKTLFIIMTVLIIAGAVLRFATLQYPTLFEPDNYVYASVAAQILHNGFQPTSQLSGVPPQPYPEGLPLVYLPAILAFLTGQSVLAIIEWLAPFFSLLGIPLAYTLTYELSKNQHASLLAATIYAFLPAALSRGMAGMWRGEVAVPILLGFSALMLIKWYSNRKPLYAIASIILFVACIVWWNGGAYVLLSLAILTVGYLVFRLLKSRSSPLLSNRAAHIAALMIAALGSLAAFHYYSASVGLQSTLNIALTVTEQMSPTILSLIYYYAIWVLFFALAGVMIAAYYENSEKFDMAQYVLFAMFIPSFFLQLLAIRWSALFALPVAIYGAYGLYAVFKVFKPSPTIVLGTTMAAIIILIGFGWLFAWGTVPQGGLDPQIVSAVSWLNNNTSSNSLVMTLWVDGPAVEAIGNRESYSDSIQGGTQMPAFGQFLFAKAGNYTYLNKTLNRSKPNYLLVRGYWLANESIALIVESGHSIYLNNNSGQFLNTTNVQQLINGTNLQWFVNGTAPFKKVYDNNASKESNRILIYRLN